MDNETFQNPENQNNQPNQWEQMANEAPAFRQLSEDDRPEGVRDEQDYQEYQAEKQAREDERQKAENLESAKDFLKLNYSAISDPNNPEWTEEVEAFLESNELKTVVDRGISMADLVQGSFIAAENNSSQAADSEIFNFLKTKDIISDMASVFNDDTQWSDGISASSNLITIIQKRKENAKLSEADYDAVTKFPFDLQNAIFFGSDSIEPEYRSGLIKNAIENFNYDEDGGWNVVGFHENVYDKLKNGAIDDYDGSIAKNLGTACRNKIKQHLFWLKELQAEDASTTARSLIIDSSDLDVICKYRDDMQAADISDAEMLESVYYKDSSRLVDYYVPSHYLARHTGILKTAGFSEKTIVDTLHDHDTRLHFEEVEDMREAGSNDIDIIYASRAYIHYHPERKENNHLKNGWVGDLYKANFSESDLLAAALREIRKRK